VLSGTAQLGPTKQGTVFKLTPPVPPSTNWTEAVIYEFPSNGYLGTWDAGKLLWTGGGDLYAASEDSGVDSERSGGGDGTVFRLVPPETTGADWTGQLLHVFDAPHGQAGDGTHPESPLLRRRAVFYGTTATGGAGGCDAGTAYQLSRPATQGHGWAENVFSFPCDGSLGTGPTGPLFQDASGTIYGAAEKGGASGQGAIFALTPPSLQGGSWTGSVSV